MSTVYLVSEGCYSDYRIIGVFSDPKKAEIYAAMHDDGEVTEWEVDDITIDSNDEVIEYAVVNYWPFSKKPFDSFYIKKGLKSRINFNGPIVLAGSDGCCKQYIVNSTDPDKIKKIFYDEYSKQLNEYLIELGGTLNGLDQPGN